MKPIILIGGGGHCKSVIEAAVSSGREILGILDCSEKVGSKVLDFDVIGTDDDISQYVDNSDFVITVGHIDNPNLRKKIAEKVILANGTFTSIIASTANVSRYAKLGEGSVVLHGAMVNADAIIGDHCIINTLANIEHDSVIGNFTHVSTGAMVNGNCNVGDNLFLGSQVVLRNGINISEGSVIAAGSFVRKSITIKGIYAGNPAILMRKL